MKDTKINFPIIALGYGKVDSKGELLNVHFENIVSKTSEEYDSVASQDISKNIDKDGYLSVKVILDQDSPIGSIEEAYLKLYLIADELSSHFISSAFKRLLTSLLPGIK